MGVAMIEIRLIPAIAFEKTGKVRRPLEGELFLSDGNVLTASGQSDSTFKREILRRIANPVVLNGLPEGAKVAAVLVERQPQPKSIRSDESVIIEKYSVVHDRHSYLPAINIKLEPGERALDILRVAPEREEEVDTREFAIREIVERVDVLVNGDECVTERFTQGVEKIVREAMSKIDNKGKPPERSALAGPTISGLPNADTQSRRC
jgi:hypothetical protein